MAYHTGIYLLLFLPAVLLLSSDAEKKQMDYAAGSRLPFFLDM